MNFKVIIAGGRDFSDKSYLASTMEEILRDFNRANHAHKYEGMEIISGMARGADRLGYEWAKERGLSIQMFPANWGEYGKRAGYIRNEEMAREADGLVAFYDGISRGTGHMINMMERLGKQVIIKRY